MTVYHIGQITIKNREEYDKYANAFQGVFEKFDGEILSVVWDPKVVAGEWNGDRSVVLEFPTKAAWKKWITSPEYETIAVHRIAGAHVDAVLVESLDHKEPEHK